MGLGTAHVWHSLTYSPKISFSVKTQNIGQKYSTLLPVFPRRLNLRWVEMRPANDIPCGRTTSPRMDRSDRTWYILNHKVFLAISQWPTVYSRPLQNAREPYNTFTVSSCIQACLCGAIRPDGQIVMSDYGDPTPRWVELGGGGRFTASTPCKQMALGIDQFLENRSTVFQ